MKAKKGLKRLLSLALALCLVLAMGLSAFAADVEFRFSSIESSVKPVVVPKPFCYIGNTAADRAFEREDKICRPLKCFSYYYRDLFSV